MSTEEELVFAADTLVHFRGGHMLVHTTHGGRTFETVQPQVIGWLCQFSRPLTPARAAQSLSPADQRMALEIVDYLRGIGVLVPAQPAPVEPDPVAATALARNHLRTAARHLYELASDLEGLGPFAEASLRSNTGVGVERRAVALLAAIDALRHEFEQLRTPHLQRQLQHLGVRADSRDLKLHIGCGEGRLPGWIDMDVSPAPLSLNVLWGLPFSPASARVIFVSHLLEHLYFPNDVRAFLAELRRVLAPGGTVRIIVPDIERCIAAYVSKDQSFFANRRETWSWWPQNQTRLQDFLNYAGAGPEPSLFDAHKYGYDFETIERVLHEAGFSSVSRSEYMESAHPELRVDHASKVAGAQYSGGYYSLFVEAQ